MQKRYIKLFSLFIFSSLTQLLIAQTYSIKLNLPDHKNDTVLFAHYYNGKVLVNDSLVLDQNGKAKIEGNEILPQGIYQLYFNKEKQIDFLLGKDQSFLIKEKDKLVRITGAKESEKFQSYIDFLIIKKKEAKQIDKLTEQGESTNSLEAKLQMINDEVQTYFHNQMQNSPNTFYGKFVASNIYSVLPEEKIPQHIQNNDSLKMNYTYQFNKNHYWDNFDLSDIRMWYTPSIKTRLSHYFNNVLIQQADSVLPVAIQLIEANINNSEVFQNLVSFLLNNSVKSKYVSIEKVFVAIAEKYYLSGMASWASSETIKNISREVYFRKNNLIGSFAKELVLEDKEGAYHSLFQQNTPYTIVLFWEPNCGHCKKQVPKLFNEVFLKTDPSELTIIAVCTQDNKNEWLNFITENELNGWINVWDPKHVSNFQVNYNVRTTPLIYLLDKDKKILAKKLSVENTKRVLDELISNN